MPFCMVSSFANGNLFRMRSLSHSSAIRGLSSALSVDGLMWAAFRWHAEPSVDAEEFRPPMQ